MLVLVLVLARAAKEQGAEDGLVQRADLSLDKTPEPKAMDVVAGWGYVQSNTGPDQ